MVRVIEFQEKDNVQGVLGSKLTKSLQKSKVVTKNTVASRYCKIKTM